MSHDLVYHYISIDIATVFIQTLFVVDKYGTKIVSITTCNLQDHFIFRYFKK